MKIDKLNLKVKSSFMRTIVVAFFILCFKNFIFSQISEIREPISFLNTTFFESSKESIYTVELPYFDNKYEEKKASEIKSNDCENCKNNYYGNGIDILANIITNGNVFELEDGGKLWLMKFKSPTAYGMQFYFNKFKLPKGASLYIFNDKKSMILGGYTSKDNPNIEKYEMKFGTPHISGNEIYLEYYEPPNPEFHGELQVGRVIHIFKNIFDKHGPYSDGSESCNINVYCNDGSGSHNARRSVAIILIYLNDFKKIGWCSGALINNTCNDGDPLFLTAAHCLSHPNFQVPSTDQWIFVFNHETKKCTDDGSELPYTSFQSVYGAEILSANIGSTISDWLLLRLNTTAGTISDFQACYAGWDLDDISGGKYVGIHHPSGDVKKISTYNGHLITTSYLSDYSGIYNQYHWKVDHWDKGTTEGGSSGSPLFNIDKKIVGQLHGGKAACDNPTGSDWYGKFSVSWEYGNFGNYLDPCNKGVRCLDTYCPDPSPLPSGPFFAYTCSPGGNGMSINGNRTLSEIPCIDVYARDNNPATKDKNIVLKSSYRCEDGSFYSSTYCKWCLNEIGIDFKGKDEINNMPWYLNKNKCHCHLYWFQTKCECIYARYSVAICEVDKNNNVIGQEYSKYYYRQIKKEDGGILGTVDFRYPEYLYEVDLSLSELIDMGITFVSGKYYRIKVVVNPDVKDDNNNKKKEDIRYFRYLSQDLIIKNNINTDLYATKITIQNTTITNNHTVAARDQIIIKNSSIKAGTYKIDKNMNCENMYWYKSEPIDEAELEYQEFAHQPCGCPASNANNKITDNNDGIIIYPVPATNYVSIASETKMYKIEISDNIGKILYTKELSDNYADIDISFLAAGSYIIKIENTNKTVYKKLNKIY